MKFFPSLDTVKEIAAGGEYRVLPVSCQVLSDLCTPIQALRILKNVSTHCYLLESVTGQERWGRYTFLGFDPKLEITCMDGVMRAGSLRLETREPARFLRQLLEDYRSPRFDCLPPLHRRSGGLLLL